MPAINAMKAWMQAATPTERDALAEAVGTSAKMLYHYAAGPSSSGFRAPSPERGAAIERVTRAMHKSSGKRLPVVYRTDLVPACRACEFARKCLGDEIVDAGAFPVITG